MFRFTTKSLGENPKAKSNKYSGDFPSKNWRPALQKLKKRLFTKKEEPKEGEAVPEAAIEEIWHDAVITNPFARNSYQALNDQRADLRPQRPNQAPANLTVIIERNSPRQNRRQSRLLPSLLAREKPDGQLDISETKPLKLLRKSLSKPIIEGLVTPARSLRKSPSAPNFTPPKSINLTYSNPQLEGPITPARTLRKSPSGPTFTPPKSLRQVSSFSSIGNDKRSIRISSPIQPAGWQSTAGWKPTSKFIVETELKVGQISGAVRRAESSHLVPVPSLGIKSETCTRVAARNLLKPQIKLPIKPIRLLSLRKRSDIQSEILVESPQTIIRRESSLRTKSHLKSDVQAETTAEPLLQPEMVAGMVADAKVMQVPLSQENVERESMVVQDSISRAYTEAETSIDPVVIALQAFSEVPIGESPSRNISRMIPKNRPWNPVRAMSSAIPTGNSEQDEFAIILERKLRRESIVQAGCISSPVSPVLEQSLFDFQPQECKTQRTSKINFEKPHAVSACIPKHATSDFCKTDMSPGPKAPKLPSPIESADVQKNRTLSVYMPKHAASDFSKINLTSNLKQENIPVQIEPIKLLTSEAPRPSRVEDDSKDFQDFLRRSRLQDLERNWANSGASYLSSSRPQTTKIMEEIAVKHKRRIEILGANPSVQQPIVKRENLVEKFGKYIKPVRPLDSPPPITFSNREYIFPRNDHLMTGAGMIKHGQ